ncbi:hypothetical protein EDM52_00825 [Brevibacillus invocatus]|uniref:BIG2 domain-containing protein n=1 Tax=Brevibacillus invocatus TaxID=173959 RepID=A0A3M8CMX2_9BACL|nr:S8 family serine peptidase [Brevibacillus invocatus]RNB77102.1 hypothetical protein EDM52_00825 [Brevibacillus invocatus]
MHLRLRKAAWGIITTSLLLGSSIFSPTAFAEERQESLPKIMSSETGEYIIKLKNAAGTRSMSQLGVPDGEVSLVGASREHLLIKLPASREEHVLDGLAQDPNIEYIEPNIRMRKAAEITDPRFEEQWGLQTIQAPQAWESKSSGAKVTVAVIDSGVDYTHPDLVNRVDTRNGYDYVNGDDDPMDDEGHGTHVAGIIAAELNQEGIAGVSGKANVEILPLKVLNKYGEGTMYDVSFAIMDAADLGADVINLSLTGERSNSEPRMMEEAIRYALKKGAVVVAAAGNDADRVERYLPASLPGVIAVSAVDQELELAKFSNYGSGITLAAPGEEILSTFKGGRYAYSSGTSQATPFVSGTVALLKVKEPKLSVDQIKERLIKTAVDLGKKGRDSQYGYGLVNAYQALQYEPPPANLRSIAVTPSKLSLRPAGTQALNVTATYDDRSQANVTDGAVWKSQDETVAKVDKGEVHAIGFGKTKLTASFEGKQTTIPVEVVVSRLESSERRLTMKPDAETDLKIYATYGDKTREEVTPADVIWKSRNEQIATVKEGIVTAHDTGSTSITASYGGKSVTIQVSVKMTKLVADPAEVRMRPFAKTPVTLYAYYGNEREDVTDEAEWKTSNAKLAVVEEGMITTTGIGTATITGTYRGKSVRIRVDTSLRKLTVSDSRLELKEGEDVSPVVTATYPDLSTEEVMQVEWSSSNEKVAVVDEQGKITAIKEGMATITANYGGKRIRITIKVVK